MKSSSIARNKYSWSLSELLIGVLMLAVFGSAEAWTYRAQTNIDWYDYGEAAFDQAAKRNRPLFILIYADWCEWCKKYELETLETKPIRGRLADEWVPVLVDYDREPGLARKLGATLVPTTVLVTPKGEKILRFHGIISAAELTENLDLMHAAWRNGELPGEEFGDQSTCCPLPNENPPDR